MNLFLPTNVNDKSGGKLHHIKPIKCNKVSFCKRLSLDLILITILHFKIKCLETNHLVGMFDRFDFILNYLTLFKTM